MSRSTPSRHRRLILLLLAGPALAIGLACSGTTTSGAPAGSAAPAVASAKLPGTGTPVRDGMFEFVVTEVRCGVASVGGEYLNKTAQGQFCLVTMTVRNIGTEPRSLSAGNQRAFGPDGVRYEADSAASLDASPTGETFWTDINPGNQVTGVVAFDIPKTARLIRLELHDSAFSRGVPVQVA